jgi:prepilin-type N-terminal cleavage/methylation domain-containing protein
MAMMPMPFDRTDLRDSGFTLVEIMTSVGLLVVVLSAAWLMLGTSGDNLNRIGNGGQAGEANRAALAAIGRDITHGVVPSYGSSPIMSAEATRMVVLADVDVNGDGTCERALVVWSADSHKLLRAVTVTTSTITNTQPETEADFAGGDTTTSTVLTGLADSAVFSYSAKAGVSANTAADVGLVTVRIRNGLPTWRENVVDRTSAFRVVAFVINQY